MSRTHSTGGSTSSDPDPNHSSNSVKVSSLNTVVFVKFVNGTVELVVGLEEAVALDAAEDVVMLGARLMEDMMDADDTSEEILLIVVLMLSMDDAVELILVEISLEDDVT